MLHEIWLLIKDIAELVIGPIIDVDKQQGTIDFVRTLREDWLPTFERIFDALGKTGVGDSLQKLADALVRFIESFAGSSTIAATIDTFAKVIDGFATVLSDPLVPRRTDVGGDLQRTRGVQVPQTRQPLQDIYKVGTLLPPRQRPLRQARIAAANKAGAGEVRGDDRTSRQAAAGHRAAIAASRPWRSGTTWTGCRSPGVVHETVDTDQDPRPVIAGMTSS